MASIVLSGCLRSCTRLRIASSAWQEAFEAAAFGTAIGRTINDGALADILVLTFLADYVRGTFIITRPSWRVKVYRKRIFIARDGPRSVSRIRRLRRDSAGDFQNGRSPWPAPKPSFLQQARCPAGARRPWS